MAAYPQANKPLPTVQFSTLGDVSARESVRINISFRDTPDQVDVDSEFAKGSRDLRFDVSVLYPTGGRVVIAHSLEGAVAWGMHRELTGAITQWATLEEET